MLVYIVACEASVSVLFQSKGRAKNGAFFASRFISRAAKTENLVPRSFFAPKQHRNTRATQAIYIAENHSKVKIIPHGQQSINHKIIGEVNVRHSFQGKTAIKRDINKPKAVNRHLGLDLGMR